MNIRTIEESDFGFIAEIAKVEGIRYTEQDLNRILSFEPEGCFIAVEGERRLGIATTVVFGKIGWIGNVFVAESARRRGAGTRLVKEAIRYLQSKGAESSKLYCFLNRVTFYRNLGFRVEGQVQISSGKGRRMLYRDVGPTGKDSMNELLVFDERFFGADRSKLLCRLLEEFGEYCFTAYNDDRLIGYIMASGSENEYEVGPWVVEPEYQSRVAGELLKAEMNALDGKSFELATPTHRLASDRILSGLGLHGKGFAVRMGYGRMAAVGVLEGILGIGGLDRG
ncbi:MAG: GNAT family N-acetyltransferase [Candidatus Bathyarchaeia archaeon]